MVVRRKKIGFNKLDLTLLLCYNEVKAWCF